MPRKNSQAAAEPHKLDYDMKETNFTLDMPEIDLDMPAMDFDVEEDQSEDEKWGRIITEPYRILLTRLKDAYNKQGIEEYKAGKLDFMPGNYGQQQMLEVILSEYARKNFPETRRGLAVL